MSGATMGLASIRPVSLAPLSTMCNQPWMALPNWRICASNASEG
jgi:hypothetical protein